MLQIADYYNGADQLTAHNKSPDYTRISPSSVANFFSSTRQWYGETLLGEPGFEGSDYTILGTLVHFFADLASRKIRHPDPALAVSTYLDHTNPTDRDEILSLYREMSNTLIAGCITGKPAPTLTEHFIYHQLLPGVYAAGTIDALIPLGDSTYSVRDYKTASTKPTGIPYHYRMQAHVYAYILTQLGYHISQIELQYVIRPTKTLPCRHFEFIEPFTTDDLLKIEGQLLLIAHSIKHWHLHPEHRYLLAQDFRLFTPPPKPPLFLKD